MLATDLNHDNIHQLAVLFGILDSEQNGVLSKADFDDILLQGAETALPESLASSFQKVNLLLVAFITTR